LFVERLLPEKVQATHSVLRHDVSKGGGEPLVAGRDKLAKKRKKPSDSSGGLLFLLFLFVRFKVFPELPSSGSMSLIKR